MLSSFDKLLIVKPKAEKNETGHGEAGWWNQQFINADADKNGLLDFDEFNKYIYMYTHIQHIQQTHIISHISHHIFSD